MFTEKGAPPFCQFLGLVSNSRIYPSLCRAHIYLLRIGTHSGNIGEELVYYHL